MVFATSCIKTIQCFKCYLLSIDLHLSDDYFNIVWTRKLPIRLVSSWRLLRSCIPMMDNLIRWVLQPNVNLCVGGCGKSEDIDHLFLFCGFFEKIWYDIFCWPCFTTVHHVRIADHLLQFENLGGFSKNICTSLYCYLKKNHVYQKYLKCIA